MTTSHSHPVPPIRGRRIRLLGGYEARVRIDGAGPPLIYVPGMDGTGKLFYRQVPRLSERFRVATYALRDDAATMDALVDDLAAVLGVAGGSERAILVAESFGGALALTFALRHPERVRALVVLNSFPFFRPQRRLRLAIRAVGLMPWGAMRIVRRLTAFRLHSRHTHRDDIRKFLRLTAGTTRTGYRNRLGMLTRYDVRDALPSLRPPALFLAADQDHLIPSVEQARLMTALVPNGTMRILRGHGHSCFLARALDLDAILREWAAPDETAVSH